MNLTTAVEIFTQPRDLMVSVSSPPTWNGRWGFVITRGPGHDFKLLISTDHPDLCPDSKEKIIVIAMELLRGIVDYCGKELVKPDSVAAAFINPDRIPVAEMVHVLTEDLLQRIEKDLGDERGCAETFTYENPLLVTA